MSGTKYSLVKKQFVQIIFASTLCLATSSHAATAGNQNPDVTSIKALIATTYDKPDEKVTTDPVAIAGNHSVAGWTQGERGGRALLRRDEKGWAIVLCGGKNLRGAQELTRLGVPAAEAKQLELQLAEKEQGQSAHRRHMFDLFDMAGDASTAHHKHHGM